MKRFLKQNKFPLLVILSSLIVGALPIVSVLIASAIAEWGDCTLHEGFVNPCQIGSWDLGETLYTMAVAGWYSLLSIPLGILGVKVGIIWMAILGIQRLRKKGDRKE